MLRSAAPKKVCCVFDEAIDATQSDLSKYAQTRDLAHLKFLPGTRPTMYWIDRIPRSIMLKVVGSAKDDGERNMRAFQAGVMAVDDYIAEDGTTRARYEAPNATVMHGRQVRCVTDEDLELFPVADINEIGEVAYWHSFLRPGKDPYYPLPLSSQSALATLFARRVGTLNQSPPSSEQPRDSSTETTQPASGVSGPSGTATDATAPAKPSRSRRRRPRAEST